MKAKVTDQVLVSLTHDGRYNSKAGRELMLSFVSGRTWSLDGVEHTNAEHVAATDDGFITISQARYNEFLKAEMYMRDNAPQPLKVAA